MNILPVIKFFNSCLKLIIMAENRMKYVKMDLKHIFYYYEEGFFFMNKNLKHTYLIDLHLNQLQKRYKTLVYDISCTNFIHIH